MNETSIELGDEVRDTVTPFQGIVIGITEWLNGCRRLVVQPRKLTDKNSMPSTESIDETQVVIVKKRVVLGGNTPKPGATGNAAPKRGGPRPDPVRHATPSRF